MCYETGHITCSQHPRNPLGCSYALVAERLLNLPPGELLVLSWILAARRATACLGYSLSELGACTGLCGRTVQAHVASLRAKGLVDRAGLRATPAALTKSGERHARVDVRDLMAQPTGAAWRLHLFRRLHSDRSGRLRISRRYLADSMGRSTRAVRDGFRKLRALGIETPGRRLSLVSENQAGRAQPPERLDGPVALRRRSQRPRRGAREGKDPVGLRRFEHRGGVGGHDHLAVPLPSDSANERIHIPLEDYVLVGVGFVQKQHRAAPPMEEGEQQDDLKSAAARARKIERPLPASLPVIRPNVGFRG